MESSWGPIAWNKGEVKTMCQLLSLKNPIWEVAMATSIGFLIQPKTPLPSMTPLFPNAITGPTPSKPSRRGDGAVSPGALPQDAAKAKVHRLSTGSLGNAVKQR